MTFYLCDRRRCKRCSNAECRHTTSIRHAINRGKPMTFINLMNGDLYEIEVEENGNRTTETKEET